MNLLYNVLVVIIPMFNVCFPLFVLERLRGYYRDTTTCDISLYHGHIETPFHNIICLKVK